MSISQIEKDHLDLPKHSFFNIGFPRNSDMVGTWYLFPISLGLVLALTRAARSPRHKRSKYFPVISIKSVIYFETLNYIETLSCINIIYVNRMIHFEIIFKLTFPEIKETQANILGKIKFRVNPWETFLHSFG